ncbi:MAG: hypothetical protein AAF805_10140 [Planctomycetota bacterium]
MEGLADLLESNVVAAVAGALVAAVATVIATRMQTAAASKARREELASGEPRCTTKILYAKVVRFELQRDDAAPLYVADASRTAETPLDTPVFDETVYTSVETYDRPTSRHEYSFRSSGVADLLCLAPWRSRLRFTDRGAASDPHQVRQVFTDEARDSFVVVTHAYNGLQPGNEDFGMRMPEDIDEARLVVDLSSIPALLGSMTEAPRGELRSEGAEAMPLSVLEYRRGIYCIEHRGLRRNDVLLLDFTFDWERL